jgi:hypothetical protein
VARVDPDDDSLTRYLVQYYAYDPSRRERRYQTVVAFDNETEFDSYLDDAATRLRERRAADPDLDPREGYTKVVKAAGEDRRQRLRRVASAASEHGGTSRCCPWTGEPRTGAIGLS